MNRILLSLLCFLFFFSTNILAVEKITNESILQMSQIGLDDTLIIAKITNSESAFNTSPNELIKLKEQGISSNVLSAMIKAEADAEKAKNAKPEGNFVEIAIDDKKVQLGEVSVEMQTSHRKRWIPVYGSFASPEIFAFINGKKAPKSLTNTNDKQLTIHTTINPTRIKLVKLGQHRSGKRYTVFSKNKTDTEVAFSSLGQTKNGMYEMRTAAPVDNGEYALLISPEIKGGNSLLKFALKQQFISQTAFDFSINGHNQNVQEINTATKEETDPDSAFDQI